MKYIISILILLILTSCEANSDSTNESNKDGVVYEGEKYNLYLDKIATELPEDYIAKLSYAFGLRSGFQMLVDSSELDLKYFISGLIHGINGDTTNFLFKNGQEFGKILTEYEETKLREKDQENQTKRRFWDSLAAYFIENEERIIQEALAKANWEKDAKGFWKIQEKKGKGHLIPNDMTMGHIVKMWLPEDSTLLINKGSYKEPFHLFIAQTLPPMRKIWDDGVKIGDVYNLLVPSELAFGEKGLPDLIPKHAPVLMRVEVISSKAKRPMNSTNFEPHQQQGGLQPPGNPKGFPRR